MLFIRTLGLTFAIASIFIINPKGITAASVPLFDNIESMDTKEELLPLTTTFKEFNWKGDSTYAGQTFIVSLDEPAQFQVTDYKNRGDHFDIYDNRLWIGRTSTVEFLRDIHGLARTPRNALGDSHFSQGVFGLDKGTHIITIKATSPYGEGSGAIRLITGIDSEDSIETEGDYLPPPIEYSSADGNSTNANATTSGNDQYHDEKNSTQISDNDTSSQEEIEDKEGYDDGNKNEIKNNDSEDNEESDKDNENNDTSQIDDDDLDYDASNSTSPNHESEDVPPSSTSSLSPQTSGPAVTNISQATPSQTSKLTASNTSQADTSETSEPATKSNPGSEDD
ncbi:hypothetical protein K501DRAFT_265650 [Backusella circina FSU 941]|nr:hypothetical protein K501DRAFT_265650 [Backusella circina FSU 941]